MTAKNTNKNSSKSNNTGPKKIATRTSKRATTTNTSASVTWRNAEEQVLLVNGKTNRHEGSCARKEMRAKNLWHRACYVFVENSAG